MIDDTAADQCGVMISAAIPSNEQERLEALRCYAILDTPPESAFDRITAFAAELFEVPIALVTLVDRERQFFKSKVGLESSGTPREISFCSHAILTDDVTVVEDATRDPRFAENPDVTGGLGIRFYAGAPLVTPEGYRLGTLCVIDRVPRYFSDTEARRLTRLAATVVSEMELRREATKRQLAEARLSAALAKTRETLESIADAFFSVDADGKIIYANAEAERVLSGSRQRIVGRTLDDPGLALDAAVFEAEREHAITSSQPVEFEWCSASDGAWYITRIYPVADRVSVYMRDITPRKQAQAALAASEERHRAMVEQLGETVFELDRHGRWTFVNDAWSHLSGFSAEQTLGQAFLAFIHPDHREAVRESLQQVLRGQSRTPLRVRIPTTAPTVERLVELRVSVVRDSSGALQGFVGSLYDLTDTELFEAEREARREAEAARARAEELLASKAALLDNMSHELRTPITAIIGFSEILMTEGSEVQQEFAGMIEGSGKRLLGALNSILELAQLEGRRRSLDSRQIDLAVAVRKEVAALEPIAAQRGLELRMQNIAEPLLVSLDEEAFACALHHVIANALKFSDRGEVVVRLGERGDFCTCTVEDTGPGMERTFLPKAFDAFAQESRGRDRLHEGCGLGLTVAKGLIELMGGSIDITSEKGRGTRVEMSIPLSAERRRRIESPVQGNATAHEPQLPSPKTSGVRR